VGPWDNPWNLTVWLWHHRVGSLLVLAFYVMSAHASFRVYERCDMTFGEPDRANVHVDRIFMALFWPIAPIYGVCTLLYKVGCWLVLGGLAFLVFTAPRWIVVHVDMGVTYLVRKARFWFEKVQKMPGQGPYRSPPHHGDKDEPNIPKQE